MAINGVIGACLTCNIVLFSAAVLQIGQYKRYLSFSIRYGFSMLYYLVYTCHMIMENYDSLV
jgi:hypothetical protein